MINWKLLAMRCAEPLYNKNTYNGIARAAHAAFEFEMEDYSTEHMTSSKYKLIYNWVMTLGAQPMVNSIKLGHLHRFLNMLGMPDKDIQSLYHEFGYWTPVSKPASESTSPTSGPFDAWSFHPEVISHCKTLFEQGHYFLAMSEACKAYNIAVKRKLQENDIVTTKDGRDLMMSEFGEKGRIHARQAITESDINALEGIKFLSAGLIQGFRNPTSHETMQTWQVDKQDCLDVLSLASYLFRKLDKATVHP